MKKIFGYFWIIGIVIILSIGVYKLFFGANKRARTFGGTQTIELPKGQRFVNATWKEDDLWYITEPMDSTYKPHPVLFQEQSSLGILEGKVIFVETR